MGLSTLRGSGPPPPGFYRCWDPKCPARRSPSSGKMEKSGAHYHPLKSNPAYSPKTGARCSCRPGVQRDNCPRCEGTGWVIDFKKIHERREQNPARWAHGTMSYRQPPGSVIPMTNNPRGGQFYLNRRRRRNPHRRNPAKGGGTNWLLIGGLAVGAFFLLRPTTAGANPLTSLFGGGTAAAVPPGYTPIGSGLYRSPTGQIVARNPQTGQMVAAPAGSTPTSAEDLLTRAGISLIPSVANTLASWVSSMFSTQQTATGAITTPLDPATSDVLFGSPSLPPLAPLPDSGGYSFWEGEQVAPEGIFGGGEGLPPLNELPTYPTYDWGTDWGSYEYGGYEVPGVPPLDYDVMIGVGSGDVVIANPDEWYGFFGLGARTGHRRPYMGLRATPPVY